jgi:hypothetical protein
MLIGEKKSLLSPLDCWSWDVSGSWPKGFAIVVAATRNNNHHRDDEENASSEQGESRESCHWQFACVSHCLLFAQRANKRYHPGFVVTWPIISLVSTMTRQKMTTQLNQKSLFR